MNLLFSLKQAMTKKKKKTNVNNIMHSIVSNVGVYINNQQIYNSNGFYAHKS